MNNSAARCSKAKSIVSLGVIFALSLIISLFTGLPEQKSVGSLIARLVYVFVVLLSLYALRPNSVFHKITLNEFDAKCKALLSVSLAVFLIILIAAMQINPVCNNSGEHRNQYEELADSIVSGHLYIDQEGEIPQELLDMENPYDPDMRAALGIECAWDHAFYNGHYYMYFGVVPCIVLFVPFRMLFGTQFPTLRAAQLFAVLIVLGIFYLLYSLSKKYSKKITANSYFVLSAALSCVSVLHLVKAPGMYCMAISSGVCFALWGFIFLFRAFMIDSEGKKFWAHLVFGALFSAFIFGCRPSIGLICLTYIPMGLQYAWKNRNNVRHIIKTVIVFFIPFIVVAVLLMLYNYVRFGNPFEFGQAYQLTIADQSNYSMSLSNINLSKLFNDVITYFFMYKPAPSAHFPFLHNYGVILLYPILLVALLFFKKSIYSEMKKNELQYTYIGLLVSVAAVVLVDSMWSPVPLWRYTLDFLFIICIAVMFPVCFIFKEASASGSLQKTSFCFSLLGLYTIFIVFLMFFVTDDLSIMTEDPETFKKIYDFLLLR